MVLEQPQACNGVQKFHGIARTKGDAIEFVQPDGSWSLGHCVKRFIPNEVWVTLPYPSRLRDDDEEIFADDRYVAGPHASQNYVWRKAPRAPRCRVLAHDRVAALG